MFAKCWKSLECKKGAKKLPKSEKWLLKFQRLPPKFLDFAFFAIINLALQSCSPIKAASDYLSLSMESCASFKPIIRSNA